MKTGKINIHLNNLAFIKDQNNYEKKSGKYSKSKPYWSAISQKNSRMNR